VLLAGPARDIFLVGDDDQTIYAWRLADVRRVLGLAAQLPGLRRVDLVTNYRCPAPVVERAVRLVERNRERFAKRIVPARGAGGALVLAPDPGDPTDRARRLLRAWGTAGGGTRAVLARTNLELAPIAAAALEMGIAYRAAEDGLVLDDPALEGVLGRLAAVERPIGDRVAPLPALAAVAASGSADERRIAGSMVGWSAGARTLAGSRAAVEERRLTRTRLRTDDAALILATAHGTKGLEFDHVACIGLDEGVFPSARTLAESDDPERALEEERRLAYVAWTRARRSLTLIFDPCAPSVFLREAFDEHELAA
jgi:DNA helicase II / ATP-dependent DNA helicase PcrA